jgi:hypothetical protein
LSNSAGISSKLDLRVRDADLLELELSTSGLGCQGIGAVVSHYAMDEDPASRIRPVSSMVS